MHKKTPLTLKLAIIICISALIISIWAISFTNLQQGQIAGESTANARVNITISAVCGDGTCSYPPEDFNTCPADCTGHCGDVVCDLTENSTVCCTDCGCPAGYNCVANACVLIATPPISEIIAPVYSPNIGGGGAPPISGASFTLTPDVLRVVLSPGQTVDRIFTIKNDGTIPLNLFLKVEGLKGNLVLSDEEVYLSPGVAKMIRAVFYAYEDHPLGIYTGSIIVEAKNIIKEVTTVLEVQSLEPMFDIEIFLPERFKKVYAGEAIEPQITIYSKIGYSDVHVYYEIKDSSNNVVLSEDEILTIRNQLTVTKTFILDSKLELGNYVIAVRAEYAGTVGTTSEVFSIVEKRVVFSSTYLVLILLLLAIILYLVYLRRERR